MLSRIFQAIFKTPGKVIVNGVEHTGRKFQLVVDGMVVDEFTSHPAIEILGDVETVETVSGDVNANNLVKGSIKTVSGDVRIKQAGSVQNIQTVSGDVEIN